MAVYKNKDELMNTDWQGKINEAVAKGDMAAAAQYEQARNDKINSGNYAGKQTTTSNFSQYLNSGSSNKTSSNKTSSGTDMGRRQDLAGQSVKVGDYTYHYDDLGYAIKKIKDGGAGATGYDPAKMDNLNYLAGGNTTIADMVAAAQKGDWDLVGSLSNGLGQDRTYADGSTVTDLGYANDVMDLLTDLYKYNAEDYYKGKYDSVYGEGAWDGAQQPVSRPTMDALESLLSGGSSGGDYGGGSFSSAPPEYEGSKWDSVLDSLAQQLLEMTYEDWTQGDQYKALSDRYGQQGKMSMQDVLGQIASRTGGLASSYATTAAQQQYNAMMSQLESAAREMYGLERGDLLDNAQLAQKYSQEDYDRYLDAWNRWNTDRNFQYDAWRDSVEDQRYTDAYTDKKLEAQAEMMAAVGDFSGYKALGYTDEQIALLEAAYQSQLAADAPKEKTPKAADPDDEEEYAGYPTSFVNSNDVVATPLDYETIKKESTDGTYGKKYNLVLNDVQNNFARGADLETLANIIDKALKNGDITEAGADTLLQALGY